MLSTLDMSLSSLPLTPSLTPEFNRAISQSFSSALASATHSDQVNSAKLFSVAQHHDYDQFKGMVAGAHLKAMNLTDCPLDALVTARGVRTEVGQEGVTGKGWKDDYRSGGENRKEARLNQARSEELMQETITTTAHQQPRTPHDLKRDWRRLKGVDDSLRTRWVYLLSLHSSTFPSLMKGGAGLELMGDWLTTLHLHSLTLPSSDSQTTSRVYDLLTHLSRVDRFSIHVACLSKAEKQSAGDVVAWLARNGEKDKEGDVKSEGDGVRSDETGLAELRRLYKVPEVAKSL